MISYQSPSTVNYSLLVSEDMPVSPHVRLTAYTEKWMFGAVEEDRRGLSGPSPSLQALKQAAAVSQDKLIRWSSPRGQQPGSIITLKPARKTDTYKERTPPKKINYPLSLAIAAEKVNLTIWETGIVSE